VPLVQEDCERMPVGAPVETLRAVAVGSGEVAKFLHARYGSSRAEVMGRFSSQGAARPVRRSVL